MPSTAATDVAARLTINDSRTIANRAGSPLSSNASAEVSCGIVRLPRALVLQLTRVWSNPENRHPCAEGPPLQQGPQPHAGAQEALRIDRLAIDAGFVMQMRPGGAAGRSELADHLAEAHGLADLDIDRRQMAVAG